MCSAPDVPKAVQRQDSKLPERDPRGRGVKDSLSRRRGYAALMKTASGGDMTPVSTTAQPAAQKLGA